VLDSSMKGNTEYFSHIGIMIIWCWTAV